MKKILKKVCGLLSFAIALNTLTSGVNSSTSVVNAVGTIKGDVNCDGIVSGVDALSMRKYLLGQDELDHRAQMNSDIDDNEKINIVDMILITEMLISNTGETTTTSESDDTVITTSDQTVTSAVTTSMTEQETQPVTTTAPDQTTIEKVTTTPEQMTTAKVTTAPKETTTKVTTTPKQTTTKVTTTPKQTTTKVTTTPKQIPADTPDPLDNKLKKSILTLVNEEREKNGLEPVTMDVTLSYVADIRAMELSDFFDTDRPDGNSYQSLLKEYGLNSCTTYEYVMAGHTSASSVLNVMLKRGAFLDNCFTKIGIGYYDDGGYFAIIFT